MRERVLKVVRASNRDQKWFIQKRPIWLCDGGADIPGFSAGDPRDDSIWAVFVY